MYLIESIKTITDLGYEVTGNILSDQVAVLFSVPSHEWNELGQSKEWKDFVASLEKCQEEYVRKRPPIVGCQVANSSCKGIYCSQAHPYVPRNALQRVQDTCKAWFQSHLLKKIWK